MKKERLKRILFELNRYELKGVEKQFVQSVEQWFNQKMTPADQQGSVFSQTGQTKNPINEV